MSKLLKWMINCAVLCASATVFGYSNPIEGGATETVTNVWTVPVPWMMVGSNSGSNTLFISSGGQVNNLIGIIGNNVGSEENMAFVSGSNAVWNNSLELSVGNLGSDNDLGIFDGGRVNTLNAYIGKASSNNFASISGAGSELSATTLHLGHTGAENTMGVFDGGHISSDHASIGHWLGADGNYALATGTNSVWENSGTLNVGEHGADSLLLVTDAGTVRSAVVNVGTQSTSSNNAVSLWGDGALLDAAELNIGGTATTAGGTGNRVSIRNGATIAVNDLTIHDGNKLDLHDGGTFAINNDFNASTAGFNWNDGGHLSLTGNLEGMPVEFDFSVFGPVSTLDGERRALTLDGGSWSNTMNVAVGYMGTSNRLSVTNGGYLSGNGFYIGMKAGSSGNELLVSGSGSALESTGELFVGYKGHSNSVSVLDGGTLNTRGGQLGFGDSNGNSATVSGAGSRWDSSIGMIIGQTGSGNTLGISDGGVVSAMQSTVGYFAGADSNAVVVTGKGSRWENANGVYLGVRKVGSAWYNGGQGNSLTVEDGGRVLVGMVDTNNLPSIGGYGAIVVGDTNGTAQLIAGNGSVINSERAYIGLGAGETGSVIIGKDSEWSNSDWIYVGKGGAGNTLLIQNGGAVGSGLTLMGHDSSSSNNSIVVTGSGSAFDASGGLHLGRRGDGNRFEVLNGATATMGAVYMASEGASSSNAAVVHGVGSVWNAGTLSVGYEGRDSRVEVLAGGQLNASFTRIGRGFGASGNSMLVSGEGSVLTNNGSMYVGDFGDNNGLWIEDGGQVYTEAFFSIGDYYGSTGNTVVVTGDGSKLESASSSFLVGNYGGGNSLYVLDGAEVENTGHAQLGYYYLSDGNKVVVSGTNSAWRNTGKLTVGYSGEDNTLLVADGGLLTSKDAEIGRTDAAHNNHVLVSGTGSVWENNGSLIMGGYDWNGWRNGGRNNRVVVQDGGWVLIGNPDVGAIPSHIQNGGVAVDGAQMIVANGSLVSGNEGFVGLGGAGGAEAEITGAGSRWDTTGTLNIGYGSSTNTLRITDGGRASSAYAYIGRGSVQHGYTENPDGNSVIVSNGVWENTATLHVGVDSANNSVQLLDGGQIVSDVTTVSYRNESSQNNVLISGTGTVWSNTAGFTLGQYGGDNTLTITNGGALQNAGSTVIGSQSRDNRAVVSGVGSMLENGYYLTVGNRGSRNSLDILDGGSASSQYGFVGFDRYGNDNRLTVSGSGSALDIENGMFVGREAAGNNSLVVTNGGAMSAGDLSLGAYVGSLYGIVPTNNLLQVTGAGSVVNVSGTVRVGVEGRGNRIEVVNGGVIDSSATTLGVSSGAENNRVLISGPGSVWSNSGSLVVGQAGSGNSLAITNGGSGYVEEELLVGFEEGADDNQVVVSGVESMLEVHDIVVGQSGSGNRFGVLGGASVDSSRVVLGYEATANNNEATVAGVNARWEADSIMVGLNGDGNRLEIMDGGTVTSHSGFIGVRRGADGNTAVVSGGGSVWQNRDALYLGMHRSGTNLLVGGTANSLTVSNGGWVFVGDVDTNNMRQVNSSGGIAVGDSTGMAEMVVANQSTVTSGGSVIGLGENDTGSVLVTGQGTEWNLTGSLPTLPPSPGALYVGHHGSSNRLTIADGAKVVSGTHWASPSIIGVAQESTGNVVVVTGDGSTWDMASEPDYTLPPLNPGLPPLVPVESVVSVQTNIRLPVIDEFAVGNSGSGNQLIIEDGGLVRARKTSIGRNASANSNLVFVTGEGSRFHNSEALYLGGVESGDEWFDGGSGNTLSIQDGGYVYVGDADASSAASGFSRLFVGSTSDVPEVVVANGSRIEIDGMAHIGYSTNQSGSMTVMGKDSVLFTTYQTEVGGEGSGNRLEILDGGTVISKTGAVGAQATAENNTALVSGESSRWLNEDDFKVGSAGSGNSLTIADGGLVLNERGFIGQNSGARGNAVTVTGAESAWSNTVGLAIGEHGDGNSLKVADGATVFSSGVTVGSYSSASNNAVTVTGNGSQLVSSFGLNIGHNGDGSRMTVSDGGLVVNSGYGYLGFDASDDNLVEITGAGSVWSNKSNLIVGRNGSGNQVNVASGGELSSAQSIIGDASFSSNNAVTVSGAGSSWINSGDLHVGYEGSGNALTVSSGGTVGNRMGSIGVYSSKNTALVTGAGSSWTNASGLYVGAEGDGNSLTVSDGGSVSSDYGYIGRAATANGNAVMVSDADSIWQSGNLFIGDRGAGNSLVITNGGTVTSDNSTIGIYSPAVDNAVLVSGAGSSWSNSGDLYLGHGATGNSLMISGGGHAENVDGYIGYRSMASGNSATISGDGSVWENSGRLHVGYNGHGNTMVVEEGGYVYSAGGSIGHGASAYSNSVTVTGEGSSWNAGYNGLLIPGAPLGNEMLISNPGGTVWTNVGNLVVGGAGSGSNAISVTNGGAVAVGGEGLSIGSGNVSVIGGSFTGGNGGVLAVGGNGSVLDAGAATISGGTFVPTELMYEVSYGDLAVGRDGSFNTLAIEDGGLVAADFAIIGETSNAWLNSVSVSGEGSELRTSRDLSLGGRMSQLHVMAADGWENDWIDGGRGNSLHIEDGGSVTVGRDMHNRNYSSVNIEPGAQINVGGDYYQDASSTLRFGVETNAAGAPLSAMVSVGGTAEFERDTRIEMASNVGRLHFDTFYTNKIIEADKLIVAGIENPDALDLEQLDVSGTLVDVVFSENNADIVGIVGRRYLAESAGFDPGSMMGKLAKEIDDLSLLGHTNANNMVNLLNTMAGAQQHSQMMQTYARATPNYLHIRSLTEGMGEIKKHTERFQAPGNTPEGARGIYNKNQELQAWVKPYGAWADHDAQDGFSGYNHNVYGTIVGLDKPVDSALLGLAGGYGRSVINQDDGDSSEAKTGYGVVYLNWGTESWFSDVNAGFGRSKVEQESGTDFGNRADFHANNMAVYLGGGKEIRLNRCWTLVPKASVLWSYYYQEGYTDESTMGAERVVAPYERDSLLSSLGGKVTWQKEYDTVVWKPEARLYWLHEFNADDDRVDYTINSGMGGEYSFVMPAPEQDVLEAGLGISALLNDDLQVVFDVDGRMGEDYSAYAVSGRAVFMF